MANHCTAGSRTVSSAENERCSGAKSGWKAVKEDGVLPEKKANGIQYREKGRRRGDDILYLTSSSRGRKVYREM